MDWMGLLESLTHAIITVVIPIITYYLTKFIRSKYAETVDRSESKYFRNTLDGALDLLLSVVNSTSQTYVDNLKKDGLFTSEAQTEAFRMTKATFMNLLSVEAKEVIKALYGDIDEWVNVQIENAVRNSKMIINGVISESVEG